MALSRPVQNTNRKLHSKFNGIIFKHSLDHCVIRASNPTASECFEKVILFESSFWFNYIKGLLSLPLRKFKNIQTPGVYFYIHAYFNITRKLYIHLYPYTLTLLHYSSTIYSVSYSLYIKVICFHFFSPQKL